MKGQFEEMYQQNIQMVNCIKICLKHQKCADRHNL